MPRNPRDLEDDFIDFLEDELEDEFDEDDEDFDEDEDREPVYCSNLCYNGDCDDPECPHYAGEDNAYYVEEDDDFDFDESDYEDEDFLD